MSFAEMAEMRTVILVCGAGGGLQVGELMGDGEAGERGL